MAKATKKNTTAAKRAEPDPILKLISDTDEALSAYKDPSQALELTTSHMKASFEAFIAEATKIQKLYQDFFQTAFKPMADEARKLEAIN